MVLRAPNVWRKTSSIAARWFAVVSGDLFASRERYPRNAGVVQRDAGDYPHSSECCCRWVDRLGGCGENGIVGADATGYFNNIFSASSDTASYRHCPYDSVVGSDGTVYNKSQFAPSAEPSVPGMMLVRATKNGTNKWVYRLGSTSCADRYYDVQWLTLGADGDVYFVAVPGYGCSRDSSFLVGLSASNGSLKFRQALDSNLNFTTISQFIGVMSMFAYDDGLVVLDGATLRYFDYDGDEVTSKAYTISMPAGVDIVRMYSGSDDGSVVVEYLNNTDDTYHDHTCYNKVETILYRSGDSFTPITIPLGSPCRAYKTKLMQDANILLTWVDSGVYYFRVIDSSGTEIATNQYLAGTTLFPDINGNLLGFGKTQRRFTLQLFDRTGSLVGDYSSDWMTPPGSTPDNRTANTRVGMSDGYVYVTSCAGVCSTTTPTKLHKISLPGVGMDYPRGTLLGMAPRPRSLEYVALGDSYSSGEGVPTYLPGTDEPAYGSVPENRCHRSEKAYPFLLEQDTSLDLNLSAFVACSGATTYNVLHGQNGEPGQLDALSDTTDVVSISIGGNDIGFAPFAANCVVDSCSDLYALFSAMIESTAFADRLEEVYTSILEQAPNAQVYVVGYPHLVPVDENGEGVGGLNCVYLTENLSGDARAVRNSTSLLNERISDVVSEIRDDSSVDHRLNLHFVDVNPTNSPFEGHDICLSGNPYFNNIGFSDPKGWFHPNEDGHTAYAAIISEAIAP